MQYILSEIEYAALQSRIAELESANSVLDVELLKASHELDEAAKVSVDNKVQLNDLTHICCNLDKALTEAKRDMDGMEKKVSDLSAQLAYFRDLAEDRYHSLKKVTEERNALKESLAKAQRRIEHSEHLSERRLRLANELQTEVQRLKHEPVAIVLNPSTKRYRAVSLAKVDLYERFGWDLMDDGAPVDRPA